MNLEVCQKQGGENLEDVSDKDKDKKKTRYRWLSSKRLDISMIIFVKVRYMAMTKEYSE